MRTQLEDLKFELSTMQVLQTTLQASADSMKYPAAFKRVADHETAMVKLAAKISELELKLEAGGTYVIGGC